MDVNEGEVAAAREEHRFRSIEHAHTLVPHGPAGPTPLPEVALVAERSAGPSPVRVALGLVGAGVLAGAVGSRLLARGISPVAEEE